MSDQDSFDARLAAHFEQANGHVPADAFVAATMQKVRVGRRRAEVMRLGLRCAALVVVIALSPWLIAGAARLNAALESSLTWTMALPGAWMLGVLAIVVVVVLRVRDR